MKLTKLPTTINLPINISLKRLVILLFILSIILLLSTFSIKAQTTITFSTPGTTTWTVPDCVYQITVQEWAGGGGGGAAWSRIQNGCSSSCQEACSQGGGGGGGGFVSRTYAVVPGEVYNITVGAGGLGGTATNVTNGALAGFNGENSNFSGPATIAVGFPLIAIGGKGGGAGNSYNTDPYDWGIHQGNDGTGGAGGGGSGGTTTFTGGNGSSGRHSGSCYDASGAGGGGAGTGANGNPGAAPGSCVTRTGGAGGGAGGGNGANGGRLTGYNISYQGQTGLNAGILGGGGGGAMIHNNAAGGTSHRNRFGGDGARGEVRITYPDPNTQIPTFNPVPPICSGEALSPLPTTSNEGITGAWSPTLNNTATNTYTFTPDPNQCAETTTLTITVNSGIVPTFNALPPVCNGETAPALPIVSTNGISGAWNPATVSNTSGATYTFTPNPGQCAVNTTMDILVDSRITPVFGPIIICEGTPPPVLPDTSNNGITGIWNPLTVSNTLPGSHTFTPNAGQCADPVTINTTIETSPITSVIFHD